MKKSNTITLLSLKNQHSILRYFLLVLFVTNKCFTQLGILFISTWGFVFSSNPVKKNPNITQIRNSGFRDLLKDENVTNSG